MLEPGLRIVRQEFRCRCQIWWRGMSPGCDCIRAATEEDGLCDGCREGCAPRYTDILWIGEAEIRYLRLPVDATLAPMHTCIAPEMAADVSPD